MTSFIQVGCYQLYKYYSEKVAVNYSEILVTTYNVTHGRDPQNHTINFEINTSYAYYLSRKPRNTAGGIRHADHVAPSIRTSWQSLRRQAAVAR
jgi:hypothetical protein